jgi:hypothetical protein
VGACSAALDSSLCRWGASDALPCGEARGWLQTDGIVVTALAAGVSGPDERRNHFVRASADLAAVSWLAHTVSCFSRPGRSGRPRWSDDFPYPGAAGLAPARRLKPPGPERPGAAGPHGTPLTTCRVGRHPPCQPSGPTRWTATVSGVSGSDDPLSALYSIVRLSWPLLHYLPLCARSQGAGRAEHAVVVEIV